MTNLITIHCPSCGGRLQITSDIERFTCRYCGSELVVTRGRGGTAEVQPVRPGGDRIIFNGQEYASLDDMPSETRQGYEQMLLNVFADADHDGVPDILETGSRISVQTAGQVQFTPKRRSRLGRLGGALVSLAMFFFFCCIFPLIFILPPLFSDSGKCAITTAQNDPDVIEELGQPIKPIFSFTFYYSQEGAVTQEQYLIVLNGPNGFGFLLISGYQDPTSEWLEVEFNKGERSYRIYGGPRDCSENLIR